MRIRDVVQISNLVLIASAVTIAFLRHCVMALRSARSVSSPDMMVINPATTVKLSRLDRSVIDKYTDLEKQVYFADRFVRIV